MEGVGHPKETRHSWPKRRGESDVHRNGTLHAPCGPALTRRRFFSPSQVKSLKTPPKGVKLTMEVCCHMFEIKPIKVKDPDSGKKVRQLSRGSGGRGQDGGRRVIATPRWSSLIHHPVELEQ